MAVTDRGITPARTITRSKNTLKSNQVDDRDIMVGCLYGLDDFNTYSTTGPLTNKPWPTHLTLEGAAPGNYIAVTGANQALTGNDSSTSRDGFQEFGRCSRTLSVVTEKTRAANAWDTKRTVYFFATYMRLISNTASWMWSHGWRIAGPTVSISGGVSGTEAFDNGWSVTAHHDGLAAAYTVRLYKNQTVVATASLPNPAGDLALGIAVEGAGTVASPSRYRIYINRTLVFDHTDSADQYAANTFAAHSQGDQTSGASDVAWGVNTWIYSRVPVGQAFPATFTAEMCDKYAPMTVGAAGSLVPVFIFRWDVVNGEARDFMTKWEVEAWNDDVSERFFYRRVFNQADTSNEANLYFAGQLNVYLTHDGTATGTPRSGPFRLRSLITGPIDAANPTHQTIVDSENKATNPPEGEFTYTRGYQIASTTIASALNPTGTFAYGDIGQTGVTLQHRPWRAGYTPRFGAYLGAGAGTPTELETVAGSVFDAQNYSQAGLPEVDNSYPAQVNAVGVHVDYPIYSHARRAMVFTAVPTGWTSRDNGTWVYKDDAMTVDPRISFTYLHQDDDADYATPPLSKNVGMTRVTTHLGFLASRATNANGVGINALSWTVKLWDIKELLGDEAQPVRTRNIVSSTRGGEDGWGDKFLAWPDVLPVGQWVSKRTITAPPQATGLELGNVGEYTLLASNPNYVMIVGGGPQGASDRHPTPGMPFLMGVAVFDTLVERVVPLDAGTAKISIARFNQTLGRPEYLGSDGVTWVAATATADIYYHPLTQSAGDPNTWLKTFDATTTATWPMTTLYLVGEAMVGASTVTGSVSVQVMGKANNHDGHKFDGAGFVGFPTR